MVDLDDTTRCPIGGECAGCGARDDLAVSTFATPTGVLCWTLCGTCVETGRWPTLYLPTAAEKVLQHCGHLGIDLDEMADAIDGEG